MSSVPKISSLLAACLLLNAPFALADSASSIAATPSGGESTANSSEFPKQILRTGINLNSTNISPNTAQLADNINLTPLLEKVRISRQRVDALAASPERTEARVDLMEARSEAFQIIGRTNLEIDFTLAEMRAEQDLYNEILSTFTSNRDKTLARVNAASFISNGVLWAVCEGLAIPTHTQGVYAVSSGITGILAGLIPSFASMYTLKAVNGKKKTSEVEPNMLAKLFDYPTQPDIEYPRSVWTYLNQAPADSDGKRSRKNIIIDRWIADSNIPNFTNRNSKEQLDVITASLAQKKGLSIATLSTRQTMLEQLSSEILKMKRMLLELAMVVQGDKQFVALRQPATPVSAAPRAPRKVASSDYAPDAAANLTTQAFQSMLVP